MIGILIELLISWLLLYFIEHKHLEVLGFIPTSRRIRLAALAFLLTSVYMTLYYLGEAALLHDPYHKNPEFLRMPFARSLWYFFKSVAFEELLFRGALLYLLIKYIGTNKAVLVSAVAFGIYHFFTVGLGSATQITLLFLTTGLMGYAFARAYVVTGSIWVPFALHYPLNVVAYSIFGQEGGLQLFVHAPVDRPSTAIVLVLLVIHNFIYPLVVLWWLSRIKSTHPAIKNKP